MFRFGFCSSSSDFPVSSFCPPLPLFLCVSKVFGFWSRLRALWLNVCCLLRPPGISSGLDLAFALQVQIFRFPLYALRFLCSSAFQWSSLLSCAECFVANCFLFITSFR